MRSPHQYALAASRQQFSAFQLDQAQQPEQVTESRWHQPWSEPVRQKRGLPSYLQKPRADAPHFLEPTFTFDRWNYPWSEPVRFRRIAVAQIPAVLFPLPVITDAIEARWHQAWSDPVKVRPRSLAALDASGGVGPVLTPTPVAFVSTNTLSSPVIFKKRFIYQSLAQTITFELVTADKWLYPWSLPTPRKPGLGAWQQQAVAPATPIFPNLTRLIQWFSPLNEPVRIKRWLLSALNQFFTEGTTPLPNAITITLSATEVNTDSALFWIARYNPAVRASVSVKEIPTIRAAAVSVEQVPAIDKAAASVEQVPAIDKAAISVEEQAAIKSASVSVEET